MTAHLHRIEPGSTVDLADIDPGDTSAGPADKAIAIAELATMAERLAVLQTQLYAGGERQVLLVLQGLDTSGKGGTIEHVLGAVNPVGLRITSFKAPTTEELSRDYLWRVHANVPSKGQIGVFDRSHYEDLLVVRVEGLVPEERWRRRFDHVNAFERLLVDEGTTIVKVMLHISKDEQRRRLQARLDDPAKHWKFRREDLRARDRWDDYVAAYGDILSRTSTELAPWHVIPADRKWYRNWAIASILLATLESLDLRWPANEDLRDVVIP